jgi:hypothetical protein
MRKDSEMDPATLATAAIGLLAPFLHKISDAGLTRAGESLTDTAVAKLSGLHQAIKQKVGKDPYDEALLRGVEDRPDNTTRLRTLESRLSEILDEDPEFAATVTRLLEEATAAGARTIQAADSGAVAGGNITMTGTHVAGRDMHIGERPSDEG